MIKISVFGLIYFAILAWIIIKSRGLKEITFNIFQLTLLTSIFLQIGYAVKIGHNIITYEDLSIIIYIIFSIIMLLRGKVKFNYKQIITFFILIIGIRFAFYYLYSIGGLNQVYIIPMDIGIDHAFGDSSLMRIAQLGDSNFGYLKKIIMFLIFCILSYENFKDREKMNRLILNIEKGFKIMFYIVSSEFILCNLLSINVRQILNNIFGLLTSTMLESTERYGIKAAFGFYKEPSHLAAAMMIIVMIMYIKKFDNKKLFIFSIFIMIMSGSSTSFMILPIYISLYIYRTFELKLTYKKLILSSITIIVSIIIVIIFNNKISLLLNELIDKLSGFLNNDLLTSGAGKARSNSISICIKAFRDNMLFGVGLGTTRATGFNSSFLANLGIVNGFLYIVGIYITINSKFKVNKAPLLLFIIFMLNFTYYSATIYSPIILVNFIFLNKNIKIV